MSALEDELNVRQPIPITQPSICHQLAPTNEKEMQTERSKDKALLSKYSKLDITLDDSQHDEMCKIVTELEDKLHDQLEEVHKEADGFGVASSIREVWLMDKQRNEFYRDQIKNCML